MKEAPILFTVESVEGILAGRKTQTRRVVNLKKQGYLDAQPSELATWARELPPGFWQWWGPISEDRRGLLFQSDVRCPYGVAGDRLWGREPWAHVPSTAYRCSDGVEQIEDPTQPGMCAVYKAGWDRVEPTWKSSMYMPRWASRLALEIVKVRVERVQDITVDDARAEGVSTLCDSMWWMGGDCWTDERNPAFDPAKAITGPRAAYGMLWDKINAKRGFSWASNPWVWIVEFRKGGL
jgi:hypothetical protein